VLPLLAWFLTGRIQRRLAIDSGGATTPPPTPIIVGFVAALLFGAALSLAFANDAADLTLLLFQGMLVLALCVPVY
jgi:hypothetical protein